MWAEEAVQRWAEGRGREGAQTADRFQPEPSEEFMP